MWCENQRFCKKIPMFSCYQNFSRHFKIPQIDFSKICSNLIELVFYTIRETKKHDFSTIPKSIIIDIIGYFYMFNADRAIHNYVLLETVNICHYFITYSGKISRSVWTYILRRIRSQAQVDLQK